MKMISAGVIILFLSLPVLLVGTTILSVYQTFRHVYADSDVISINIANASPRELKNRP